MAFDHERLDVYRVSIEFIRWAGALLDGPLPATNRLSVVKQLDRASTSISLNIAEGNRKRSSKDRCRYLDIARGSALECAACLDVLVARMQLQPTEVISGKALLERIVGMLSKMTHKHEHGRRGPGRGSRRPSGRGGLVEDDEALRIRDRGLPVARHAWSLR